MGTVFSTGKTGGADAAEIDMALTKVKTIVSSAPVVVFSKTYCAYCKRVKKLFSELGATFKAVDLDVESDGDAIQAALAEWTGQRTVPNVFIGGKHVGGADSVIAMHQEGKLVPMLRDAGAIVPQSNVA